MLEVYVLVERKKGAIQKFFSIFLLVLAVVAFLTCCINSAFLTVSVIALIAWFVLRYVGNMEYEYSYFDGDLKFARVMNKSRRKNCKGYQMGDVLLIAPAGHEKIKQYEGQGVAKVLNYTSHKKEVPYYEMIIKQQDNLIKVKFEPDEKYLDAVCIKYRSKVVR